MIEIWLENNIHSFLPKTLEYDHLEWGPQILMCDYSNTTSLDTKILVPSCFDNIEDMSKDVYLGEIDVSITISDVILEGEASGFHEFGEDNPYINESATLLIKGQISGNIKLDKEERDDYYHDFQFNIGEIKLE